MASKLGEKDPSLERETDRDSLLESQLYELHERRWNRLALICRMLRVIPIESKNEMARDGAKDMAH